MEEETSDQDPSYNQQNSSDQRKNHSNNSIEELLSQSDNRTPFQSALEKANDLSFDIEERGHNYAFLKGDSGRLALERAQKGQDVEIEYSESDQVIIDEVASSTYEASLYVGKAFRKDYTNI